MNPPANPTHRNVLFLLIIGFFFLLFFERSGSVLFDPDESRYAEIPRELIANRNWMTFRLNGSNYFEKPPMLYWLNAASMSVLGETPFAARLPTRLAAVGTTLLLIIFVSTPAAPLAGLWAGFIYISSLLPFALGRINLTDGILTFFLTFTLFSMLRFFQRREAAESTAIWTVLVGIGAALTMLSKGLLAIVIPGMVVGGWVVLTGRWRDLRALLFSWAPVMFLALSIPAYLLIEKFNPGFCHFFFIREHFQRYSSDIHDRTGPLIYFVPVILAGLLPWTVFLVKAFQALFPMKRDTWNAHPSHLFYGLWALLPFLFFSVSHSKLIPYVLPCFPALAALIGSWMASESNTNHRLWRIHFLFLFAFALVGILVAPRTRVFQELNLFPYALVVAGSIVAGALGSFLKARKNPQQAFLIQGGFWAGVIFVLVFLIPTLAREYSAFNLIQVALKSGAQTMVCYKGYTHSIPWVIHENVAVVGFQGELASDGVKTPELFWTEQEFWRRWNSPEKIVAFVPRRGKVHPIEDFHVPLILADNHHTYLVANFTSD